MRSSSCSQQTPPAAAAALLTLVPTPLVLLALMLLLGLLRPQAMLNSPVPPAGLAVAARVPLQPPVVPALGCLKLSPVPQQQPMDCFHSVH